MGKFIKILLTVLLTFTLVNPVMAEESEVENVTSDPVENTETGNDESVDLNESSDDLIQCGDNVYYRMEDNTMYILGQGPMWDFEFNGMSGVPSNVESVFFDEGITTVGDHFFHCAFSLREVYLPESMKSIGEAAFADTGLTSIHLPEGLETIGTGAFCSTRITNFDIPATVTNIGKEALATYSLESINVHENNTVYYTPDNSDVVMIRETNELLAGCKNSHILDGTTGILSYAFAYSQNVNLTIPASVTSIGEYTFMLMGDSNYLTFDGNKPYFFNSFSGTIQGNYPGNNSTWTDLPDNVNWVALGGELEEETYSNITYVGVDGATVDAVPAIIETDHTNYGNDRDYEVIGTWNYPDSDTVTIEMKVQTESPSFDWFVLLPTLRDDNGNLSYQYYIDSTGGFVEEEFKFGDNTLSNYTFTTAANQGSVVIRTDGSVDNFYGLRMEITPSNSTLADSYCEGKVTKLPSLIKENHKFDGWYLDADYTQPITEISSDMNGDITLYAKFTEIRINSIIYANLDSTEVALEPVVFESVHNHYGDNHEEVVGIWDFEDVDSVSVKLDIQTEDGCDWVWLVPELISNPSEATTYIDANGNREPDSVSARFGDNERRVITFTTSETKGSVIFRTDGSVDDRYGYKITITPEVLPLPTSYEEGQNIALPSAYKEGYTFDGWFTDPEFVNSITEITADMSGDVTLYAKFVPNTYTVRLDGHGAYSGESTEVVCTYDKGCKLPQSNFEKGMMEVTYYTLDMNYTDGDTYAPETYVHNLTSKNNDVVTLYAQWDFPTRNRFESAFNVNSMTALTIELEPDASTVLSFSSSDGQINANDISYEITDSTPVRISKENNNYKITGLEEGETQIKFTYDGHVVYALVTVNTRIAMYDALFPEQDDENLYFYSVSKKRSEQMYAFMFYTQGSTQYRVESHPSDWVREGNRYKFTISKQDLREHYVIGNGSINIEYETDNGGFATGYTRWIQIDGLKYTAEAPKLLSWNFNYDENDLVLTFAPGTDLSNLLSFVIRYGTSGLYLNPDIDGNVARIHGNMSNYLIADRLELVFGGCKNSTYPIHFYGQDDIVTGTADLYLEQDPDTFDLRVIQNGTLSASEFADKISHIDSIVLIGGEGTFTFTENGENPFVRRNGTIVIEGDFVLRNRIVELSQNEWNQRISNIVINYNNDLGNDDTVMINAFRYQQSYNDVRATQDSTTKDVYIMAPDSRFINSVERINVSQRLDGLQDFGADAGEGYSLNENEANGIAVAADGGGYGIGYYKNYTLYANEFEETTYNGMPAIKISAETLESAGFVSDVLSFNISSFLYYNSFANVQFVDTKEWLTCKGTLVDGAFVYTDKADWAENIRTVVASYRIQTSYGYERTNYEMNSTDYVAKDNMLYVPDGSLKQYGLDINNASQDVRIIVINDKYQPNFVDFKNAGNLNENESTVTATNDANNVYFATENEDFINNVVGVLVRTETGRFVPVLSEVTDKLAISKDSLREYNIYNGLNEFVLVSSNYKPFTVFANVTGTDPRPEMPMPEISIIDGNIALDFSKYANEIDIDALQMTQWKVEKYNPYDVTTWVNRNSSYVDNVITLYGEFGNGVNDVTLFFEGYKPLRINSISANEITDADALYAYQEKESGDVYIKVNTNVENEWDLNDVTELEFVSPTEGTFTFTKDSEQYPFTVEEDAIKIAFEDLMPTLMYNDNQFGYTSLSIRTATNSADRYIKWTKFALPLEGIFVMYDSEENDIIVRSTNSLFSKMFNRIILREEGTTTTYTVSRDLFEEENYYDGDVFRIHAKPIHAEAGVYFVNVYAPGFVGDTDWVIELPEFPPQVTVSYSWNLDSGLAVLPEGATLENGDSYTVIDATYEDITVTDEKDRIVGVWHFEGWNKSGTFAVTTNTVIEGTWVFEANEDYAYNITYVVEEGIENNNPTTYKPGETLVLQDLTKTGYTFRGWFVGANQVLEIEANKYKDVELVARWMENQYTVAFNGNGNDSGNVVSVTTMYTMEIVLPENGFVRDGYEFVGWNTEANGSGEMYQPGDLVRYFCDEPFGTRTLYAQWRLRVNVSYTWNLDPSFDRTLPASRVVYGDELYTVDNTVYEDIEILDEKGRVLGTWTFEGWNKSGDIELTEDTVIEGTWVYVENESYAYDITYLVDDDVDPMNPTTYKPGTTVVLKDAVRPGYTFNGWFMNNEAVTQLVADENKDVTLTAKWTEHSYTMNFDGNTCNSGSVKSRTTMYSEGQYLPSNQFKKTGYEFTGWNTKADGTGTMYQPGDEVFGLCPEDNGTVTLYAQWRLVVTEKQHITYVLDGGSNNMNNPATYEVGIAVTLRDPKREGYTFDGWYLNGEKVTEISDEMIGDIELVAKWNVNTYKVTLDATNGTVSTLVLEVEYGKALGELPTPERPKYDFVEWTYNGTAVTAETLLQEASDITLVATWTEKVYEETTEGMEEMKDDAKDIQTSANTEKYTVNSLNKLNEALDAVEALKEDATEEEIAEANDKLKEAMDGLQSGDITVVCQSSPAGAGTLTGGGYYTDGETVQLSAVAATTGYKFLGWYDNNGNLISTDPICSYELGTDADDVHYVARYQTNESKELNVIPGLGKVEYAYNGLNGKWYNEHVGNYPKGTEITLTAVPYDGFEFMYWVSTGENRIVGESPTYTTTITQSVGLRAVYKVPVEDVYYVVFRNPRTFGDKVIQASDVEAGTSADAPDMSKYSYYGYAFTGWDQSFTNVQSDLVIYAQYESTLTYTVTVDGVASEVKAGALMQLRADEQNEEGKYFSGWFNDKDELISVKRDYSFYVQSNMTITSKYEGDAPVEEVAIVTIDIPARVNTDDGTKQVANATVNFFVPAKYSIEAVGVVRTSDPSKQGELKLENVDGTTIRQNAGAKPKSNVGNYTLTLNLNYSTGAAEKPVYMVGYIQYKDKETGEVFDMYSTMGISVPCERP